MSKSSKPVQASGDAPGPIGEYKVGKNKPPKEHQFKPGNKFGKGRPKDTKNMKTIVNEALGQKVPVKMGGKLKKRSKIELTVYQVATKASQGDLKAADKALGLYERYGPQDDPEGPEPEKVRRDLAALRDYLAMMDRISPPEDEEEDDDG